MPSSTSYSPRTAVPASGDASIDSLIVTREALNAPVDERYTIVGHTALKWGSGGVGSGVSLSYSFVAPEATFDATYPSQYIGDIRALPDVVKGAFQQALVAWQDVAAVTLHEVQDLSSNVGDVRIGVSASNPNFSPGQAAAEAAAPSVENGVLAGDVWISTDFAAAPAATWNVGGLGFNSALHELGHAIFNLNDVSTNAGLEGRILPRSLNFRSETVMSYSPVPGSTAGDSPYIAGGLSFYPTTPMVLDVQAAQRIYGANTSFHSGDDFYTFEPTATYFMTIWDGGGNDTISLASHTNSRTIDLRPGSYSDVGSDILTSGGTNLTHTLGIAYGATIENAIGGSGNDTLVGNDTTNTLSGGGGVDILIGGLGSDRFVFNATALSEAASAAQLVDRIVDFDRGEGNLYNLIEGDQLDFTSIVGAALTSGEFSGRLVRAIADPLSGKTAVQVDADGLIGGQHWTTIVQLDRIEARNGVKVALTASTTDQIGVRESLGQMEDFSGDGRADILWRSDAGTVALWTMNGAAVASNNTLSSPPSEWHLMATDDFTGDGKADILWRHDLGTIAMWTMNAGLIASNVTIAQPGREWRTVSTGDFDGNGKADILWRNDTGEVVLWQMNGASIAANSQVTNLVGNDWRVVGTDDFNGDGKQDILWRHDSGAVAVWTMNGGSSDTRGTLVGPDQNWHIVATGDFGGDQKADVLWRHDNGDVALWQMNGAAIANNSIIAHIDSSWHILSVTDFNGDTKSDILWRHDSGAVAVWTMSGAVISSGGTVSVPGTTWHIAGVGDLDGDQKADIQWRNDDGTLAIWLMNGASLAVNTIGQNISPDWSTVTHQFELL